MPTTVLDGVLLLLLAVAAGLVPVGLALARLVLGTSGRLRLLPDPLLLLHTLLLPGALQLLLLHFLLLPGSLLLLPLDVLLLPGTSWA